jgi:hypothetical protein
MERGERSFGTHGIVRISLKKWWVEESSEGFDKEFDVRTFSEHGFSIGKG